MENKRSKVLLIEDDKLDRMAFEHFIKDEKLPYDYTAVTSVSDAQSILASERFDVIISDYSLGDGTALEILNSIKDIPIIVVTGSGDEEVAIKAWKGGAYDYLTKDIERYYLKSIPKSVIKAIEHNKMKEALDKKQRNLQAIFDTTPVGMLLIDENMIVTRVNNAIKQIVNKEYRQIINRKIGGALCCVNSVSNENVECCGNSPTCRDCQLSKNIKDVFDSERSVRDVEINPTLKVNNEEITPWFSMSAETVIIDGFRHVLVALSDITESKKAEYERQLAEEKYRMIFENSAVAITMVDERERLISWNKFTENLLGMDREDLYLRPIRSLYPEEEWEKIRAFNIRKSGIQLNLLETKMIKKDGRIIDVDVSLSVLKNAENETTASIGVIRDITEHKAAEEKVKKMIDEKSGFISIVSHELRTSLAAIKEGVSIVYDGIAGRLNKEQKKYLDIAKRNADRLSALINNVLDFQKLETNRIDLDVQNNNVKEVISEIHETMALYAKKNKVELLLELAEDLSEANFDRLKINQVLTNLIGNAIKFTPEKGRVSINVQRRNEELVVSVSDTGIGIPKDALAKIFDCFYTVNQRGKQIQGTGLGLAIVHKIVMMHGGRIEVESEVDQGTTFTVFLPLDCKPVQKLSPVKENKILESTFVN